MQTPRGLPVVIERVRGRVELSVPRTRGDLVPPRVTVCDLVALQPTGHADGLIRGEGWSSGPAGSLWIGPCMGWASCCFGDRAGRYRLPNLEVPTARNLEVDEWCSAQGSAGSAV